MNQLNEPASSEPPVDPAKLSLFEVRTLDVERLAYYYEDALNFIVVERTADAIYLTTGADHHCVVVRKGEPNGRARVGFEIHGSLEETAERLASAGVAVERVSDPEPGIAAALTLAEPGTQTRLMLIEHQSSSDVANAIALRPTKLGHIACFVPNLLETQRFYIDVLGFRWSDTIGDFFTFLRCNRDHHAINLLQSSKYSGLYHVAWEMRDMLHLKDALDHLSPRGYHLEWGPGRHGAGHNIYSYHRDPDGNVTELFTEIDIIADEETGYYEPRPWHETWPQGPKVWEPSMMAANKWGPLNLELMDH
jgi:catechol-2,3-dioxygenase